MFLRLLERKDQQARRQIARRACIYASLVLFFLLIFGTLLLEIFEVPLGMVRIVRGIIGVQLGARNFLIVQVECIG